MTDGSKFFPLLFRPLPAFARMLTLSLCREQVTPVGKAAKDWAMHTMGMPRRGREGRAKTPASLARAHARVAEITASLRSLSPVQESVTRGEEKQEQHGGEQDEEALSRRRVLVCDLPEHTAEEEVKEFMAAFGEVESVKIQRLLLFVKAPLVHSGIISRTP